MAWRQVSVLMCASAIVAVPILFPLILSRSDWWLVFSLNQISLLPQANNRIELLNCTLIITVLLECILTNCDLLSKLMIHPLFYMLPLWRSEMCNYCPSKLDIIGIRKNHPWFFDFSWTRPEYHNTINFLSGPLNLAKASTASISSSPQRLAP